ncbi:MAG TPA: response regulator [Bryobacteraceae bacterium]|nr:response regulator [Bryobacteraceae bacterium]
MAVESEAPALTPRDDLAALKAQFLASFNHEVRTPLTGILGMTDLLLETPLDDEQREYVGTVRDCADDLLALFNKTLEFSDLSSGLVVLARHELHLGESLRSVVEAYTPRARQKGLALRCTLAHGLPGTVVGDEKRLQELLSHLLDNAVKFTDRGEIAVEAGGAPEEDRFILSLLVRDTGIGIPPDKLAVVFESFRQLDCGLSRSYNGVGLGLCLVQKLARLMGGNAVAESKPGEGSCFKVIIPLGLPHDAETASGREPGAHPASAARNGKSRILFVDDNAVAQRIVAHVLGRAGYRVTCASSGSMGVRLASQEPFDLVLVDLQMPEMDGFATAAAIHALPGHSGTPIVALTANVTEQCRRQCAEAGMQGFMPKPVLAEQLLEAVSEVLA